MQIGAKELRVSEGNLLPEQPPPSLPTLSGQIRPNPGKKIKKPSFPFRFPLVAPKSLRRRIRLLLSKPVFPFPPSELRVYIKLPNEPISVYNSAVANQRLTPIHLPSNPKNEPILRPSPRAEAPVSDPARTSVFPQKATSSSLFQPIQQGIPALSSFRVPSSALRVGIARLLKPAKYFRIWSRHLFASATWTPNRSATSLCRRGSIWPASDCHVACITAACRVPSKYFAHSASHKILPDFVL